LDLASETTVNTLGNSAEMNEQLKSINFTWNEIIVPDPNNVHN
jgi:hypothetical protein